jgi:hypothetical protein
MSSGRGRTEQELAPLPGSTPRRSGLAGARRARSRSRAGTRLARTPRARPVPPRHGASRRQRAPLGATPGSVVIAIACSRNAAAAAAARPGATRIVQLRRNRLVRPRCGLRGATLSGIGIGVGSMASARAPCAARRSAGDGAKTPSDEGDGTSRSSRRLTSPSAPPVRKARSHPEPFGGRPHQAGPSGQGDQQQRRASSGNVSTRRNASSMRPASGRTAGSRKPPASWAASSHGSF